MQEATRKASIEQRQVVWKLRTGLGTYSKYTMFKFLKLAAELMNVFQYNQNIISYIGLEHMLGDEENIVNYAVLSSDEHQKKEK
tara:strand:- start:816 stop:1067 length:252 start_codon:yes stop_codon:yes gene_type:complete